MTSAIQEPEFGAREAQRAEGHGVEPPREDSVGEILARTRAARGFTLEDVAQQLKFGSRQLEALEQDRFDRLPSGTFARGMVRSYARLLKLDADALLARMQGKFDTPDSSQLAARFKQPVPFSNASRRSNIIYAVLSVLILVAVAGVLIEWQQERTKATRLTFIPAAHLLVSHRYGLAEDILELLRQQLSLVGIEALVVPVAPPLRVALFDLDREESAEDGVSRERRGRRENAVVVGLFEIEEGRHVLFQEFPLVQSQAVHHHEHHTTVPLDQRHEKLTAHVDRQGRPIPLRLGEPFRVVARDIVGEVVMETVLERVERILKPRLVALPQARLPVEALPRQLDPLPPTQPAAAPLLELAELGHEVSGESLLADAVPFEQAGDDTEHLPRIDGLDQIIIELDADGLVHRARRFRLGDHHHGHRGVDGADLLDQLESPPPRQLLVQQDHAVRLPLQEGNRVVPMGGLLDRVPLFLEKQDVRAERFDFVVDPQNGLRTGHSAPKSRSQTSLT